MPYCHQWINGIVHRRDGWQRPTLYYYTYPYMASANCNVPMMGTEHCKKKWSVVMHSIPICTHTRTHTHTTANPNVLTQEPLMQAALMTHICTQYMKLCIHTYLHTNGLFIFCKVTETAKQHVSISLLPQRYHTGPHHILCPTHPFL